MFHRDIKLSKSHSFFLFGARGTGKSYLLKKRFSADQALYLDLLLPDVANELSAYPQRFFELLRRPIEGKKKWVIIDEIQRVPRLLDIVHREIHEKNFLFALTGSSARKLKRGSANMLAGRAFVFHLFPLTHLELGAEFDLDQILSFGSLPDAVLMASPTDRIRFLKAYSNTYLKEEILVEQIVRNLPPFQRFLEIAAAGVTEIVNFSNVARDILSDPKTASGYYQILEDTLLGFRLPSFHKSIRKQQKKAPKFYLFDCGVCRALAGRLDYALAPKSFEYGQMFENFIVNEIHRLLSYSEKDFKLSYLRVGEKQEIDLIVERAGMPTFFCEIKSTDRVHERHVDSLETLTKDFSNPKRLLLSKDPVRKMLTNTHALPWQEGIKAIIDGDL